MKIYARQVAPEHQESPFSHGADWWHLDITITGNRQYFGRKSETYENIENGWKDLLYDGWRFLDGDETGCKTLDELINIYIPKKSGKNYSPKQKSIIKQWILDQKEDNGTMVQLLTWVTGEKYDYVTIKGTCQGDWQYCFYPVSEEKYIKYIEAEYFNTGTEWIVWGGEEDDEDTDSTSFYGYEWQDEKIKEEIAEAFGGEAKNVTLFIYDGYVTTPKYKVI